MKNTRRNEGKVAEAIETETSNIPSDLILWTAVGAMALSLGLRYAGKKRASKLVSQWAAPILVMGLYKKMFKIEGHD
jgi:hypothetical protein